MGNKVIVIREKSHTSSHSTPRSSGGGGKGWDDKTALFLFMTIMATIGCAILTVIFANVGPDGLQYLAGGATVLSLLITIAAACGN